MKRSELPDPDEGQGEELTGSAKPCRASASRTWRTACTWRCRPRATGRRGRLSYRPPSQPRAPAPRTPARPPPSRPRKICRCATPDSPWFFVMLFLRPYACLTDGHFLKPHGKWHCEGHDIHFNLSSRQTCPLNAFLAFHNSCKRWSLQLAWRRPCQQHSELSNMVVVTGEERRCRSV